MGLFGGKKTYVASTVYNLAGDQTKRANYLKTTVAGGVLFSNDFSIADAIRGSYLGGPGIRIRNFYRWALDNYGLVGVPQGFRSGTTSLSILPDVLAGVIPHSSSEAISITDPVIGPADYSYWADQWMIEHHPDLLTTNWVSDYNDTTGDILITFADASIATFTPTGFARNGTYIYASYTVTTGEAEGPVVMGTVVSLGSGSLPDVTSWVLEDDSTTPHTVDLDTVTTVVSSYSDGRPDETTGPTTTTSSTSYDEFERVYSLTSYQGFEEGTFFEDDRTYSIKRIQHHWQNASVTSSTNNTVTTTDIGGGVTRTDHTAVVTESLLYDRSYREDTQDITLKSWSKTKVYIYKIGGGIPDLDDFVESSGNNGGYVPMIPIRLDNHFISETTNPAFPDLYEISKKAYKKAIPRAKLDDLIDKIADNESLGDIDFAYVMYGVSLNVLDQSCRKYVYNFFHEIMENQSTTRSQLDEWGLNQEIYDDAYSVWTAWQYAQEDDTDPLYGTPEPDRPQAPAPPISEVRIKSTGTSPVDMHFDMQITWGLIEETTGSGLKKPDAVKGELWFEVLPLSFLGSFQRIALHHQVTLDSWKTLTISGMVHKNFIYDGKYVEISAKDALNDLDESGFIIPLRYETLAEMSLIDSTQLATCSAFIVFNSYLVVKQKWYQTLFFKIILVVIEIAIILVVTYFAGPVAGMAAGAAFSAASSFAFGFDPTLMNVIFGIDINGLATIVLAKIIAVITVPIFGEKAGKAIATVAAIIVITVAEAMAGGMDLSQALKQTFTLSAQNIMKLTSAVGSGVAMYVGAGTGNIIAANEELMKNYEKEARRISELYLSNFGFGEGVINPLMLTDAGYIVIESEASFLERTLLTGSDISDMTMKLIDNFTKMNLEVELPTR